MSVIQVLNDYVMAFKEPSNVDYKDAYYAADDSESYVIEYEVGINVLKEGSDEDFILWIAAPGYSSHIIESAFMIKSSQYDEFIKTIEKVGEKVIEYEQIRKEDIIKSEDEDIFIKDLGLSCKVNHWIVYEDKPKKATIHDMTSDIDIKFIYKVSEKHPLLCRLHIVEPKKHLTLLKLDSLDDIERFIRAVKIKDGYVKEYRDNLKQYK